MNLIISFGIMIFTVKSNAETGKKISVQRPLRKMP